MRLARGVVASVGAFALVAVLGGVLTGCGVSVGGSIGVAADEDTGAVVLVVRLCEPTRELRLAVELARGDDAGTVVWSAGGRASGQGAVVRVGRAPAGWTADVDEPVPAARQLTASGWVDQHDDDRSASDLRLAGPEFVPDRLPLTGGRDPDQVLYEHDGRTRTGSTTDFAEAAASRCG